VTGLRERNKHRRSQEILAATRELLRQDPGQAPTVEAIAARANVAPATVFNLIGPRERILAALANEAIAETQARIAAYSELEPHARARLITSTTLDVMLADAAVHRHVLAHWSQSGRLLRNDPTRELLACLEDARDAGDVRPDIDLRVLVDTVSAACLGALHQWAAGLIGERRLRQRCATAVDVAFAAGATDRAVAARYLRSFN
jgi:AcrR family transcriptional regulator